MSVYNNSVCNHQKKWKQMPFNGWMNKHTAIPIQCNTTQQEKGTNYWYMQQYGWILNTLFWVKDASFKSCIFYESVYVIFWKKE